MQPRTSNTVPQWLFPSIPGRDSHKQGTIADFTEATAYGQAVIFVPLSEIPLFLYSSPQEQIEEVLQKLKEILTLKNKNSIYKNSSLLYSFPSFCFSPADPIKELFGLI